MLANWLSNQNHHVWHSSTWSVQNQNRYNVICRLGGPYWEKLCPRSWAWPLACGLGPWAWTEGTVFPNKDLPRPANNVFIFFLPGKLLYKKYLCCFFTDRNSFKPCACVWHFVKANACCLQKYLNEEIQFSLILKLSNEEFTFHGDF